MLAPEKVPASFPPPEDGATVASRRGQILALEATMMEMREHHIPIETIHHFAPGLYAREVRIPAGATVVGKIHRTEHMNILSEGEISVMTEEGVKRLKAPCTLISKSGMKRVGYAHSDVVWTTIHPTEETDLAKLEDILIAPSFEALAAPVDKKLLEGA